MQKGTVQLCKSSLVIWTQHSGPTPSGLDLQRRSWRAQGLEKYVMKKLFTHVFASIPEDVKGDEQLHEKMALIQQFIRPENLDIKPTYQNETSWLDTIFGLHEKGSSSSFTKIANYGEEYRKDEKNSINVLFPGYGHYDMK